MRDRNFGWIILACAALAQAPPESKVNPYVSDADVQQGKGIFNGQCAGCHGFNGAGGRGTDLAQPELLRAPDDAALYQVIRRGLPGTEMPGNGYMTDREVWQVAAFVRTVGRQPREAPTGDPVRGATLFRGKGACLQCHTVGFEGGNLGPVLTNVGARRGAAYLRQTLLDPASRIPVSFGFFEAVRRNGERIRGVRVNEDTWSIQLRDLNDKLHSLMKDDLTRLQQLRNQTPMPSYKSSMSGAEVDDLVAYLASLRGQS